MNQPSRANFSPSKSCKYISNWCCVDPLNPPDKSGTTSGLPVIHLQSTGKVSSRVSAGQKQLVKFRQASPIGTGGKCLLRHCACPRFCGRQTCSVLSEVIYKNDVTIQRVQLCVKDRPFVWGEGQSRCLLAGRFSRSNTRVVRWVVASKKAIPGFAVMSR